MHPERSYFVALGALFAGIVAAAVAVGDAAAVGYIAADEDEVAVGGRMASSDEGTMLHMYVELVVGTRIVYDDGGLVACSSMMRQSCAAVGLSLMVEWQRLYSIGRL